MGFTRLADALPTRPQSGQTNQKKWSEKSACAFALAVLEVCACARKIAEKDAEMDAEKDAEKAISHAAALCSPDSLFGLQAAFSCLQTTGQRLLTRLLPGF